MGGEKSKLCQQKKKYHPSSSVYMYFPIEISDTMQTMRPEIYDNLFKGQSITNMDSTFLRKQSRLLCVYVVWSHIWTVKQYIWQQTPLQAYFLNCCFKRISINQPPKTVEEFRGKWSCFLSKTTSSIFFNIMKAWINFILTRNIW